MKKTQEMTSYNSELPVSTLVQECLDWSGMRAAQFSQEVGFADATRIYGALNQNRDLGVTSFNAILRRFPLLNGDRFVRKSGPLLLSDLCDNQIHGNSLPPVVAQVTTNSEDYFKAIIQGKDNEIELLKKQVAFMEKMLDK
jgi:hypothetical protein